MSQQPGLWLDETLRQSLGIGEPGPAPAPILPPNTQQEMQGPASTFPTTIPDLPHTPGLPLPQSLLSTPPQVEWQAFSNIDFEGLGLLEDPPSSITQNPWIPPLPAISNWTATSVNVPKSVVETKRRCTVEENRKRKLAELAKNEEEQRKREKRKEREEDERRLRMVTHMLGRWENKEWRDRYAVKRKSFVEIKEARRKEKEEQNGKKQPGQPAPEWFQSSIDYYKKEMERLRLKLENEENGPQAPQEAPRVEPQVERVVFNLYIDDEFWCRLY